MTHDDSVSAAGQVGCGGSDFHVDTTLLLAAPFGLVLFGSGGFLHAPDGRGICAVTSEDGWEHFRPDTPEGAYRQKLLDKLYRFYISGKGDAAADFTAERFPDADNYYWKNLLRTMPTPKLTAFYSARLGQPPKMEG